MSSCLQGYMPAPGRFYRRLPDNVRHRTEVAAAMAWEALVEAHSQQARDFVDLFEEYIPLEEALLRYLRDMDLADTMLSAVRTRVLVATEDVPKEAPKLMLQAEGVAPPDENDDDGWRRFRPDVMMRGVMDRQKKNEELERLVELAIARAEEEVIKTHVD